MSKATTGDPIKDVAIKLLDTLAADMGSLVLCDRYLHGNHDGPYIPEHSDDEYKLLAERCVTNWMPLIVNVPVQAMYVDGYQSGLDSKSMDEGDGASQRAWDHWQDSRLDAKQSAIYKGALAYGHSFTVTERSDKLGHAVTRGLSAMKTAALFVDPANDIAPVVALTVVKWPEQSSDSKKVVPGEATLWDERNEYHIFFDNTDILAGTKVGWKLVGPHGSTDCPVTRFPAAVDLEGRTVGVVEPMIPFQDRINQTVFDLLVAQTFGSFKVRWATGMAPPLKKRVIYLKDGGGNVVRDDDGHPIVEDIVDRIDSSGRPIPEDINLNARRMMFGEDDTVKFGTLDETPLDGYVKAIELAQRQFSALTQTPPHNILGEVVNLSAEALEAAEKSLDRKIESFKTVFGECWERVFNVAAEMDGFLEDSKNYRGQVVWRDMEGKGLSSAADALNKLKEIEVPRRGLWRMIPGVTETTLKDWEALVEEDPEQVIASAIKKAADTERQNARMQADLEGPGNNPTSTGDGDLVP